MGIINKIKNLFNTEADGQSALVRSTEPLGDGKAEFLGQGSVEEWEDLQKEDSGMKPWYDRLKQL